MSEVQHDVTVDATLQLAQKVRFPACGSAQHEPYFASIFILLKSPVVSFEMDHSPFAALFRRLTGVRLRSYDAHHPNTVIDYLRPPPANSFRCWQALPERSPPPSTHCRANAAAEDGVKMVAE